MENENLKKIKLKISGMHCAACEILIERKFMEIAGVEKAKAYLGFRQAVIYCSEVPAIEQLDEAVKPHGYRASLIGKENSAVSENELKDKKNYFQIGAVFLIILGGYLLLKQFSFLSINFGITEGMSYGFVFLVGLVASVSTCLAVTGGLLLAVASKNSERHPELTSSQKLKPLLYFNFGRLFSYLVLGGAIGALGAVLTLSPKISGLITILASAAMIILGFQLLRVFPSLSMFQFRLPKFFGHKIHDLSQSESKLAPFSLGALTFFLPCGFTQALQLYVLTQGGFWQGSLIMFFFALGTLPALLSISVFSAVLKGRAQNWLMHFAGAMAILLGLFNLQNGFVLAGAPIINGQLKSQTTTTLDPNVQLINGKQVVKMKIDYRNYLPARFTVQKGIPVEWVIDASQAYGCMTSLLVPGLKIREYLPTNQIKKISFTPTQVGTYKFSCAMGMGTPGAAIIVVDQVGGESQTCDVKYADCLNT